MPPANPDILIIGAGFSGLYALHTLRTTLPNLTTHVLEAASDIGGVWHWNRYPGARVDSEWPFYQLTIPAVWRDFYFTERFPDHTELRRYFAHLDKTLDLKRDITFNARVNSAVWDEGTATWTVRTESGIEVRATYLLLCSGVLHRPYIPAFRGLDRFLSRSHPSTSSTHTDEANCSSTSSTGINTGINTSSNSTPQYPQIFHSSAYPTHLTTTGKRIAVIGAGATGVQIVQDLSKTASQLTLFIRRPSACLPMRNRPLIRAEQDSWRPFYPILFRASRHSRTGIPFPPPLQTPDLDDITHGKTKPVSIFSLSAAEREKYYESLWTSGSFNFGSRNFPQCLVSEEANRLAYAFWAKKTRARMSDPVKREMLAPLEPVDFLFTRRMPLEGDFYESVDRENVEVVRVKGERVRFTERGGIVVVDGDGKEGEERLFDVVVLATGFDGYSGGLSEMNIHGRNGISLTENWKSGIKTYLGITMHGFPNCFMSYTPHAPTPLSNGPTIIECQIDLITAILKRIASTSTSTSSSTSQASSQTNPQSDTLPHSKSKPMTHPLNPPSRSPKPSPNPHNPHSHKRTIEPTPTAQQNWTQMIKSRAEGTLFERTDSWWNGTNVPGKKREVVTFLGGLEEYEGFCLRRILDGLEGFEIRGVSGDLVDGDRDRRAC